MDTLTSLAKHHIVMDSFGASTTSTTIERMTQVFRRRQSTNAIRVYPHSPSPWGDGPGHHLRKPPLKRSNSIAYVTGSASESNYISWTEYTARKSLVKFRTRRSATSRSRHGSRETSSCSAAPSRLVRRILHSQYDVCKNNETKLSNRIMAVFYCWFFGWIADVYAALTNGGTEHSFLRWILSCSLVTGATMLVAILAAVSVRVILLFLTVILHAAVNYLLFVCLVFILLIGVLAIVNYNLTN